MKILKTRTFTVTAVILGVLILVLGAVVARQRLVESRISMQISEENSVLAQLQRELEGRRGCIVDYPNLTLKLGGRFSQCSWTDQMPFVVSQLTGIAEHRGLRIQTLQPQPMTENKCVRRFPLRIGLQADLAAVASLLEDIQYTTPLLDVEQLDIKRAEAGGNKLEVGMTVASFVVIDKDAPLANRRALQKEIRIPTEPQSEEPPEPTSPQKEAAASAPVARPSDKEESSRPRNKATDVKPGPKQPEAMEVKT